MQWITHDFYEYKKSPLKAKFSTRLQEDLAEIFSLTLTIAGSALVFILPFIFLNTTNPPTTISTNEILFFQTVLGAISIVLLNIAVNSYLLFRLSENMYCLNTQLVKKLNVKLNIPEEHGLFVHYHFKWSKSAMLLLILFGGLWVKRAWRRCKEERERLMDEHAGNAYGVYGDVTEEDE